MDQIKIGKFIQNKRKEKNITQQELAEILNITDRAISKWENGKCMPDVGIMQELCEILNITINDLFSDVLFLLYLCFLVFFLGISLVLLLYF